MIGVPEEKKQNFYIEILKASLIAIIIVVPIRIFIAQPYIVAGASMDPTFGDGHYLIVDQLTYRFEEPKRGDIVIFKYPEDTSKFFIKRIIGLPGETVSIENGVLSIQNIEVSSSTKIFFEPYVDSNNATNESMKRALKYDEYFVMGDNRNASSDSRIWGPLQDEFIVGRAVLRVLPVIQAETFPGKYTFEQ